MGMTEDERSRAERNKNFIIDALRLTPIVEVEILYSGYGDSGGIDSVTGFSIRRVDSGYTPPNQEDQRILEDRKVAIEVQSGFHEDGRWHHEVRRESMPLRKAIEQHAYDLLEEHHGGWEINDGANGTMTIHVVDGTIHWEHNELFTETNTTERTL